MKRVGGAAAVVPLLMMGMIGLGLHAPSRSGMRPASPRARAGRQRATRTARASSPCPPPTSGPLSAAPGIPSGGKTVALTFDDGPGPSTPAILAILESFSVPATFFNIGVNETEWPDDVRAEAAAGFLIGNHTWDHREMTTLSAAAQAAELDAVIHEQQALVSSSPCVFRPPYGDYDATTLSLASERHLSVWLWDVDTEDWEAEGSSSSYWVDRIISLAESEGGALSHPVVLMHNQAIPMPATVAALPTVIRYFQSHGYTFVDLLGRSGPPESCGSTTEGEARTVVEPGSGLGPGTSVAPPGGQFRLVMQRDGNLVMETSTGRALWASRTGDHPGAFAAMQADGNFVIYSASDRALWTSGSEDHAGASLAVQSDGNVVVEGPAGPLWCAGSKDTELLAGERLEPGWYLESPTWLSHLVMQRDGNLVLTSIGGQVLWASGTAGNPDADAIMQADGDLVVYSRSGRAIWSSGTGRHPGARLMFTGAGQWVVTSSTGSTISSSG